MSLISVVMPYWRRPDALQRSLESYRDLYADQNLEIIVVDDGSPEPAQAVIRDMKAFPWPIGWLNLPSKVHALNPCVPLNAGVHAARGELVVLTNPEIIHREPILLKMADRLRELGHNGYVAAACWCEMRRWWYCHSKLMPDDALVGRERSPKGAGLHFCAMLRWELFMQVGGFDEKYRDGQGYEDNDFLWKLYSSGARFAIADDCVTDHTYCAPTKWPAGGLKRNRDLFQRKWSEALHDLV